MVWTDINDLVIIRAPPLKDIYLYKGRDIGHDKVYLSYLYDPSKQCIVTGWFFEKFVDVIRRKDLSKVERLFYGI